MIFDKAVRRPKNQTQTILRLDSPDGWEIGKMTVGAGQTGAMKISAVNACVEILSNSMSKLPMFVMDGETHERLRHPLLELLAMRPNEAMTPSTYKKLVEAQRLIKGNAYVLIVRSASNARPRELIPLPPGTVSPVYDESGVLWYLYTDPRTKEPRKLSRWDVLHFKAYSEDGVTGISVLSRAAGVIDTATAAQQYENRLYTANSRPSGVLKTATSLEPEAKDKVRAEWEKIHSGVDNTFKVAVLDLGLDYQRISLTNEESQFVESKAVAVEDISRFFGVPLYKLGAGKQSYSSNEQNAIEYITGTLHPIVSQYEEEYTYKLLFDSELKARLEVRINIMAELRGDFATRGKWYTDMRLNGAFNVDEIRALEDLPGVPGGDTRLASLNYVPLEDFARLSVSRNTGGEKK